MYYLTSLKQRKTTLKTFKTTLRLTMSPNNSKSSNSTRPNWRRYGATKDPRRPKREFWVRCFGGLELDPKPTSVAPILWGWLTEFRSNMPRRFLQKSRGWSGATDWGCCWGCWARSWPRCRRDRPTRWWPRSWQTLS